MNKVCLQENRSRKKKRTKIKNEPELHEAAKLMERTRWTNRWKNQITTQMRRMSKKNVYELNKETPSTHSTVERMKKMFQKN